MEYGQLPEDYLFQLMQAHNGLILESAYMELRERGHSHGGVVWHTYPRVIPDTAWSELANKWDALAR